MPLILDFAKTDLDRAAVRLLMTRQVFGFPYAAPPGLLPEVRDMLRAAFDKTMADPALRADMQKQFLEFSPTTGAQLDAIVDAVVKADPATIAKAREIVQ